jgi:hypothetical protein
LRHSAACRFESPSFFSPAFDDRHSPNVKFLSIKTAAVLFRGERRSLLHERLFQAFARR